MSEPNRELRQALPQVALVSARLPERLEHFVGVKGSVVVEIALCEVDRFADGQVELVRQPLDAGHASR
jgi:hypothetical protein